MNNAGAEWRSTFGEGGYDNVRRTMEVNFDAVVRLTEALLPLCAPPAPSPIVNVSSVAGRVGRPTQRRLRGLEVRAGAAGARRWASRRRPHGVHVGVVLPGFISTEGFPHDRLRAARARAGSSRLREKVAKAIVARRAPAAGARSYVPRFYGWCRRRATWRRA